MILLIATAFAATTAELSLLAGARGDAESLLEQPEAREQTLEPSATFGLLGEVRQRWSSGLWIAGAGEVWTYAPEADSTLARLVPAAGGSFEIGERGRLDLAARYALEDAPLRADMLNGRAEATGRAGVGLGSHQLDVLALAVSRDWFGQPAWSFRDAEAGLVWGWQPSAFRLGARATGQLNSGHTVNEVGTLDPTRGLQLRLGLSGGWTGERWDLGGEYRYYIADEGQAEDAARPQFTPVGELDDDADALSAGGFTQHRLGLNARGELGSSTTLSLNALVRVRDNEPGQPSAALSRTLHAGADLGRSLTGPWSLHAVGGITTLDTPSGASSLDPYGWLLVRWRRE